MQRKAEHLWFSGSVIYKCFTLVLLFNSDSDYVLKMLFFWTTVMLYVLYCVNLRHMLAVNDTVSVCHSNKCDSIDYTSVSLPALKRVVGRVSCDQHQI